jgi:flavin-dependent dehydrogenase
MPRAPDSKYDALILGGGPAGATAGLLLARAGWHVAIVEKSAYPRRKVCGEFISATTLPLLFELGIGEHYVAAAGPPIKRVGLFVRETTIDAPIPGPPGRFGGWGRALGREHLDRMLLEAAAWAGASLWQPWKATALERHATGWHCIIESRQNKMQLGAPIVIAATGSWERSPANAALAERHRDSDLLAFKAHFKSCKLADGLMPLLVFPGGYGGMAHSDDGRVSLSCCIRRDILRDRRNELSGRGGEVVIRYIRQSCHGVENALRDAHLDGAILSAGPIRPGIRPRYRDGIFYVGNSAGEAHPVIAEGISMAMQSAWLLCRRLAPRRDDIRTDGAGASQIGHAYAHDWQRLFALRIDAASLFAHAAMRPLATAILRPLITRIPRILTLGAAFSGKARLPPMEQSSSLTQAGREQSSLY